MTRNRNTLWLATLALAVLLPSCGPKPAPPPPPAIPQPVPPAQPAPEEVAPRAIGEGVDKTAGALPSDIADLNRYVMERGLLGDIYFDFDKADLKEDARARLAKNADWLKANPAYQVTIEGHCDERGTNDYNLALGQRRAAAAMDYIASLGVGAGRLSSQSWGEERPQCAESHEGCWARNRRAHFVITAKVGG
jgi:peptidoglycan-associated lipoprotein